MSLTPGAAQGKSPRLVSACNVTLRGLGLVSRFGLNMYLAKFLGLSEVGEFGLVTGMVSMTPAVIGWGLNYYLTRDLIDQQPGPAARLIRDRLIVTVISLSAAFLVSGLLTWAGYVRPPHVFLLVGAIVALDCIAFDIHMSLISLRRALAANVLLFVRASAWTMPAVLVGIFLPSMRTLQFVLWMWAAGLVLNYVVLATILKEWPLRSVAHVPVDTKWVKDRIARSWLIYLNDVGIVGALYLDRYVVDYYLGISIAGLYTLYWSIANSVHVLVYTGVLQVGVPRLVSAHNRGDRLEWSQAMRSELTRTIALAAGFAAIGYAFMAWGMPLVGVHKFAGQTALFALMLLAIVIRLASDSINYGLFSLRLDKSLAYINLATLAISLTMAVAGIKAFGLLGAGLAMVVASATSLVLRLYCLRREWGRCWCGAAATVYC